MSLVTNENSRRVRYDTNVYVPTMTRLAYTDLALFQNCDDTDRHNTLWVQAYSVFMVYLQCVWRALQEEREEAEYQARRAEAAKVEAQLEAKDLAQRRQQDLHWYQVYPPSRCKVFMPACTW